MTSKLKSKEINTKTTIIEHQWEIVGDNCYTLCGKTTQELPSGFYNIITNNEGKIIFNNKKIQTNELLRMPHSLLDDIIKHVITFWDSREAYKKFDMPYKRGILLYGPPGCGKSSLIKFLINDIIKRNGIAISFPSPDMFSATVDSIRIIHKDKPIVCIMEDLDVIVNSYSQSSVLNILDGATKFYDNILFVATTNYPERLESRIKNRPSRFDKVIKVPYPDPKSRQKYIEFLFRNSKTKCSDIKRWVKDTENMSFAHISELFLGVNLYGTESDYDKIVSNIKSLGEEISSHDDYIDNKSYLINPISQDPPLLKVSTIKY